MKKIFILLFFSFLTLSFCVLKSEKINPNYTISLVKEVYVDRGSETENGASKPDYESGNEKSINSFIGVFPNNNDTVSVYKLNDDLSEVQDKFSFWSKKKSTKSTITFYSTNQDNIKVTFSSKSNIIINNDIYTVNLEYYNFLKQKILNEQSVLDLAYFLKDGYGDYAQILEPLTKNWRGQKESKTHKIISVKIKNRNYQTDNQFFKYKIDYNYRKDGVLESISGENRFNKKLVAENEKYIEYVITDGQNERSFITENIYKNKKTLFDSIVGNTEQYSTSKTLYFTEYQSILKFKVLQSKPKTLNDIIKQL